MINNNCRPLPLPLPETPEPCYLEIDNSCGEETLTQGETFSIRYCFSDGYSSPILSLQQGLPATLTLSSNSCFTVGDKVKVYGYCGGINGCESINGTYTVAESVGNQLVLTEGIPGDKLISFAAPPSAPGCGGGSGSLPIVTRMLNLADCKFEGKIVNRIGGVKRTSGIRASAITGSNHLHVCPKGIVKVYDCVSVPQAGIINASVEEVFSIEHYDVVVLGDKLVGLDIVPTTSQVTNSCLPMSVKEGIITTFEFDLSESQCGCIIAWVGATDQLVIQDSLNNPWGLSDRYVRGTSSFNVGSGGDKLPGDRESYRLGYYSLSITCESLDREFPQTFIYAKGQVNLVASAMPINNSQGNEVNVCGL